MKIYGIIGTSAETAVEAGADYEPMKNEILMQSMRPTTEHTAQLGGSWVLDKSALRVEEINKELAQIDETYRTPRTIANAHLGDNEAIERLKRAEELSVALRAELANLS